MTPTQRESQQVLNILVIDHPLVKSLLSILRDARTDNPSFRAALRELTSMLIYEASRNLATHEAPIETPVAPSLELAVYVLSSGAAALRLLLTVDSSHPGPVDREAAHSGVSST